MKLEGGYNIALTGRPSKDVEVLPEPTVLHLPLRSRRFDFSDVCVTEGQRVHPGEAVAKDPANFSVPLLSPREGSVRLDVAEGHVTLEDVTLAPEEPYNPDQDLEHVQQALGSAGMKRYKLLALGAWQFVSDAHTGELPDPFSAPSAVIVSTLNLEPFRARGDVQMQRRLSTLTRGLEHIQSLLEYQPIHFVVPDVKSDFARRVREVIRGYALIDLIEVPLRYPLDNFALLARSLGLKADADAPVWAMRTDGVLAIDRALTLSLPCTVRLISLGGPAVDRPRHLVAMPGYPVSEILDSRVSVSPARAIDGGALSGDQIGEATLGLSAECDGLTVIPEETEREFFGFMRPGFDRTSYSRGFLSSFREKLGERLTTALRGERRPCVSCIACEEVCPAGLMPHLIHKLLYQDALEEAEHAGTALCVGCGLCSYVCPSKIELRRQFLDARVRIQEELHPEGASE
jgi:Na+-transporting NADH:ubiquinone oxidoreductase subunit A